MTEARFPESEHFRAMMVSRDIQGAGVRNRRVLDAMMAVPRELFVASGTSLKAAYGDHPMPIGFGQTVSQPFIVALMLEMLHLRPGSRVLEVGTGSGYQTAVLACMGVETVTLEVIPELATRARAAVANAIPGGMISYIVADGYLGWEPAAPYDGIIVSASPERIPEALEHQLSPDGGRLVIPVGGFLQKLVMVTRNGDDLSMEESLPVRFVPLVRPCDGRKGKG